MDCHTCQLNIFQRKGISMANTKKMVIAVYGNLYIGNIDTEKLHSQGGFLVTATDEEIQEAIKDIYWLDVRVIRQDVRYENILLGDDVQLCVYATGDIQVGSRMSMMSTRSVSPALDFAAFYALQGNIINAPLNPQEVYKLLGVGKYKGTWWDIGYLNKDDHGKTNKYSRFKPVPGVPSGANIFYPNDNANWFTGADGKCGLDVYTSSNMQTMANYVLSKSESERWSYIPPQGGNEPFRITDFEGYMHDSIKPLYIIESYEGAWPSGSNYPKLRLYYMYNKDNPSLFLTDIIIGNSLQNWYLAAVFVNTSTGQVLSGSCNQYPLGDPSELASKFNTEKDPFVIPLIASGGGFETGVDYTMIPVLSKNKKWINFTSSDVNSSDLFCDLPIGNGKILLYALREIGCYLDDSTTYWDDYGIFYNVLGGNDSDKDVELGGFTVELWQYDRDYPGSSANGYKIRDLYHYDSAFIPANTKDYEIRAGEAIKWGTYPDVSLAGAYDPGYFIKLIGDDPKLFISYVSRRLVDKR